MDESEDLPATEAFYFPEDGELDPRPIAARLVAECTEFQHLRHGDAAILFLMRAEPKIKAQKAILGEAALPRFQGSLGPVASWLLAKACGGIEPDFLMILDATWWAQAAPKQREALVYHEMCHMAHALDKDGEPRFTEEGDPVWAIKGHDIEEFNAVVERYGAWLGDIESFIHSLRAGGAI